MGLFSFFKSKKENGRQTESAFISEIDDKGISFEEAKKVREEFMNILDQDDRSKAFNSASSLMLNKAFDECIEAYEILKEKYPDSIDMCESQIGAANFFKGNYEKAINNYVQARELGADEGMMDDNIWEACEVAYKKTGDLSFIKKYLEICPTGGYLKKAKKLIK